MEHTIVVWSRLKKRNEDRKLNIILENRINLSEEELLEIVLEKWKVDYEWTMKEDREYTAELEETKH